MHSACELADLAAAFSEAAFLKAASEVAASPIQTAISVHLSPESPELLLSDVWLCRPAIII